MKIAVIGAGAMGSIYGGHLSTHHEVYLVDTNASLIDKIQKDGLTIQEDGQDVVYHPHAVTSAQGLPEADLVILFVKSLFSKAALKGNQEIIGNNTYVMTLQNGSGHEDIIGEIVTKDHIIIGTTEDNGAVLNPGHVRRGGTGRTNVGMLTEDKAGFLTQLKETLDGCGFDTVIHDNIQKLIWEKLFTNVSLSVTTALLQVPMGYVTADAHAWFLAERLIREALAVARGLGLDFEEEAIIAKVRTASLNSPEGITSICADLQAGRKTEVDTISGSVVRASKKCGISAPTHEFVVEMIHAMEERT